VCYICYGQVPSQYCGDVILLFLCLLFYVILLGGIIGQNRSRSASDSAYSCTFLCSTVCLPSVAYLSGGACVPV